jgi:hypothetical protein
MKTFKQFVFGNDEAKKLNESVEEEEEEDSANEMKEEETSPEEDNLEEIETTNEEEIDEPSSGLSEGEEEIVAKKMTLKEKIAAINDSDVLSSSFGVLPKD